MPSNDTYAVCSSGNIEFYVDGELILRIDSL